MLTKYIIFKLNQFLLIIIIFIYLDDDGDGVAEEDCAKPYPSMLFSNKKLRQKNKQNYFCFICTILCRPNLFINEEITAICLVR